MMHTENTHMKQNLPTVEKISGSIIGSFHCVYLVRMVKHNFLIFLWNDGLLKKKWKVFKQSGTD
jgi:hypothetical protein